MVVVVCWAACMYVYVCMYIYICVCVCMCVCLYVYVRKYVFFMSLGPEINPKASPICPSGLSGLGGEPPQRPGRGDGGEALGLRCCGVLWMNRFRV